ncbi:hypothetical protein M0C40_08670 [Spiroplasma citri]|uniref:Distal tail protein N-terminal domain-containing protein n=1 Tax=Spiroplasma citri TaxID=2133 RepID=A0AAX3SXU0_SPICI|nr:hypothetical protein [Spiroplasma citri]WFG96148.1 hypothetical protein M0C40_08670 [Spiroplasma citri]
MYNLPFRTFKISNSKDNLINLCDLDNIIILSFNGLNINFDNNYLNIDNNFILNNCKHFLNQINFKLLFIGPNPYGKFNDFINKLNINLDNKSSPFLLFYSFWINEKTKLEYYCEVIIKSIIKTELNNNNDLEVDFILEQLTNWKKEEDKLFEIKPNKTSGKRYNEHNNKYYFKLNRIKYTNQYNEKIKISNNSYLASDTLITINGPTKNQYLKIENINSKVISELKINAEINENEKIIIDSRLKTQSIIKVDLKTEKSYNIYQYQDFKYTNFIQIPPGNYHILYSSNLSKDKQVGNINIKKFEEYILI